ncbi:MAG TPA: serine hydrolase domain-containing protein, partial [Planctomycetota bacterium]|nr:serine hydrolase domain-containing protein [Planctomycetota bacterium]
MRSGSELQRAFLVAAACLASPGPRAQEPAPSRPASFPDSPLGAFGRELVERINEGDPSRQTEFLRRHLSRAALEAKPLEESLDLLATIRRQSGGLDVAQVGEDGVLEIVVQTRRGGRRARIWVFSDPAQRDRVGEFGVIPLRDPAVEAADAWNLRKMTRAEAVAEIERHVAGAAARDEFSGVVLVAEGEFVLFHKAYGLAEKGFLVPNRPDTKFNLASMNKMFTAVSIAQLVQAGKLRFEDKLIDVLPDYPNPEAARKITIEHLLTHTAGLGPLFERPAFDRRTRYRTAASVLPVFARETLAFEPGTRASYSNEGFVVLGAVIERISGQSYFDHVRERVFKPCGMGETDSYAIDEVVPNLAVGYARFEDDPLGVDPRRPNWIFLGWRGSSAGGGYSTAPDLLRFVLALKAHRLVNEALTETLVAPHGVGRWYGYGFQIRETAGKQVRGHGGGGPNSGISADLQTLWDGNFTAIVLSNYDGPATNEICTKIVDLLAL